jgi:Ca2+-binding RTX toxin-like protein
MLIQGTDGPDNLTGLDSDDVIVGKKGDDFRHGGADLFTFYGGHGATVPNTPIDGDSGAGDGADASPTTLFVALGGTAVVDHNDFIIT